MDYLKINITKIIKHPLFSGSAIMVVGSNLTNVVAYFYHLVMGRLLGPAAYGDLVSTLTVIGLISSFYGFFGIIIIKIVSTSEKKDVGSIFNWFSKKAIYLGLIISVLILLGSLFISEFLHLSIGLTVLISPIIFVGVLGFVYKSFLQGLMRFGQLVISNNLDMLLRLAFGVVLVLAGYSVFGAIVGIFLAFSVSALVARHFLKDVRSNKSNFKFNKVDEVVKLSLPVFALSFMTISIFSTDLLLVKHYFDSHTAGLYGALSNMGKIIFFAISPVAGVMFPLVSKRFSTKQDYKKLFYLSIALVAFMSSGVLFIYYFFPELAIGTLFGAKYLSVSKYLFIFGVFTSLFSLNILVINFFLAKDKFLPILMLIFAGVTQFIGILTFHESIIEVITVSLVSMLGLAASLLIYYWYEEK